ncbi:MAG TPA: ribonuclease HII, partial [Desulfovibrio sp.]|nr:ribonuclease HII [Desulfovibrio sp.]
VFAGQAPCPARPIPTAPTWPIPAQRAVIGGDALVPAVSAASILAKTFRDRLMVAMDNRFPGYGLALHKGYGTAEHMAAIADLGPCPQHRTTFRGVRPEAAQTQGSLL